MPKYYLVKYKANWADEFDVYGHEVLNEEEFKLYTAGLDNLHELEYCFGTNQEIHYKSNESLKKDFTFQELTQAEYEVLKSTGLLRAGDMPGDQVYEIGYDVLRKKGEIDD